MNLSLEQKRQALEWDHEKLSLRKQIEILGLSSGAAYYDPIPMSEYNLGLMDIIDRQYLETPFYGSRKMVAILKAQGYPVNRKRVQRLMEIMGIEAIYPKPNLSQAGQEHKVYPYLLKGLAITQPNQVWSTDITYLRIKGGFVYLVAIIDWFSRYVLGWRISNSMEVQFCLEALEDALKKGVPEIHNSDQGTQFTCNQYTSRLELAGVKISMDSKGRALDNIFIERLWRSLKYEEIYLKDYKNYTPKETIAGTSAYLKFYNEKRPHQSLTYKTPQEVHYVN